MIITSAQYIQNDDGVLTGVKADIDGGPVFVPINTDNRHYAEILRQVDAGELTIADAD